MSGLVASIADGFGDRARVVSLGSRVALEVHEKGLAEEGLSLLLTPQKARRLAKALRTAAKEIEK